LLTAADAEALGGKGPAPQGEPPPPEPPPRLARVKTFRSALSTWDTLFAEAAEFVTQVGPDRLITISHSADEGEGVIAVWYWEGPEWDGMGAAPAESPPRDQ